NVGSVPGGASGNTRQALWLRYPGGSGSQPRAFRRCFAITQATPRREPRKRRMSGRSGILAGGNWIVDRGKVIDTYPCQDALASILSEAAANGGSPFNLLVDLSKLGARFPLLGTGLIGADADGEWVMRTCAAHGIDTTYLSVHPTAPTSYSDVMTVQQT